jgi:hypothetical protein
LRTVFVGRKRLISGRGPHERPPSADPAPGTPILYLGWKIIKKTKFKSPLEVHLYQDLEEIEEYTKNFIPKPNK